MSLILSLYMFSYTKWKEDWSRITWAAPSASLGPRTQASETHLIIHTSSIHLLIIHTGKAMHSVVAERDVSNQHSEPDLKHRTVLITTGSMVMLTCKVELTMQTLVQFVRLEHQRESEPQWIKAWSRCHLDIPLSVCPRSHNLLIHQDCPG